MKQIAKNLIYSFVCTTLILACSESGISQEENSSIIGTWQNKDTATLDVINSSGEIIGKTLSTATIELIFNKNDSLTRIVTQDYSPQYDYPNKAITNVLGGIVANNYKYSYSSVWKISGDTLSSSDAYYTIGDGVYRTAAGLFHRHSISYNTLTLTTLSATNASRPSSSLIKQYYRTK